MLPECSIRDLARPFLQSHLHITELALIQLCIEPFLLQQFLMLAGLQNMSVLHNQNHIRFLNGRQPVCHHKARPSLHQFLECFLDTDLCHRIDGRCRLVQNQYRRF